MATNNKVIDFQQISSQADNPPRHMINRGDGKMAKTNKSKKDLSPIVKISLVNYDPAKQDEYCKKFMAPLIEGLLQRTQLAKAE